MRSHLFIHSSSLRIESAIKKNEIHRMAGTSEDVTLRMKNKTFGHVGRMSDERMAKKIYEK